MRKFYSFVAFALMMVLSVGANAQTMTEENPTLDQMGYRLEKDVNFVAGTNNGKEISPMNTLVGGVTESYKINSQGVNRLANEGLEFMSIQLLGNGIDWPAGHGLRSTKNERWIVVNDLRVGQILALELTNADTIQFVVNSEACNSKTNWEDTPVDPLIVEPISGAIHELQEIAEEGSADAYRYFKVINAGAMYAKFNGKTAQEILRLQIWSDKNDSEVVSAPSLKIVGVKGDSRKLEFKPGESTLGAEVRTFYTTDGSDPVFLKETDEVETWTYTYDEETGEVLDSVPATYKKVLDTDAVEEYGTYGDNEFNPEDGSIDVYASDAQEDGNVVVKAASVSENGIVSAITVINVPIGEIALNEPTLSLVGINGIERTYKIGWANNTLCGESYSIIVEGAGADDGYVNAFDENTGIGELISIKEHVKVTVSVNGYTDGVLEFDAMAPNKPINRKNTATDAEGKTIHDWDFVNISGEMKAQFTGSVIAAYRETIITETDTTVIDHTIAEYDAAEEQGIDVSNWEEVPEVYGWWQPISSNRTTLNVIEGGLDQNANGYGYEEEKTGIFHDLMISCPPNANNASCIFKYIDKEDGNELGSLGVYFMARPTITISRDIAKAGELVEVYYGQGGSNYTSSTIHDFYEVPTDDLLTITLPNGGVHVFYIDVYTYEGLPEDVYDPTAIEGVNPTAVLQQVAGYYSVSGARLATPAKGINIVKYSDGSTKKVLVK